MIITRTPFRVSLGGGGTDLPAYYKRHGGFVFSYSIDKYMYIQVTQPIVDDLVRIKYSEAETVENTLMIKHALARAILLRAGIENALTVVSTADIPAGTGLASSATYGVGLLKAIHLLQGNSKSASEIAEEAIDIEMNVLGRPIGKQDQYMVAIGGLTVMEIDCNGKVTTRPANVLSDVAAELEANLMLFYTGQSRGSSEILSEQTSHLENAKPLAVESMHTIKELGMEILSSVEKGNLDQVGLLMDKHWEYKKKISSGISNVFYDKIYTAAKAAGALGGKIVGAGGGGFFVFYVPDKKREFRARMKELGLRYMAYRIDYEGTKVLLDIRNISRTNALTSGKYTSAY